MIIKVNMFTSMQDEVFYLNLVPKYIWWSEICLWSAKPHCSEPDHVESKQDVHCQIIMCRQKREQSKVNWNNFFYFAYCL